MNQQNKTRWAETSFYRPKRRFKFRRPGKNFKPLQGEQLSFDFEQVFEPWRPLITVASVAELVQIDTTKLDTTKITPANPITDDDIPF